MIALLQQTSYGVPSRHNVPKREPDTYFLQLLNMICDVAKTEHHHICESLDMTCQETALLHM